MSGEMKEAAVDNITLCTVVHYGVYDWYNITLCTVVYSCVQLCTAGVMLSTASSVISLFLSAFPPSLAPWLRKLSASGVLGVGGAGP